MILENGFWGRAERDERRETARGLGVGVELRFLDIPLEELWRRIEIRNGEEGWREKPIKREQLEEWARSFQTPDEDELALFDAPQ